jgi:hypothetical protein
MTDKIEHLVCPEGHFVSDETRSYAKDFSDESVDADGILMYEDDSFCIECNRSYGLNKLKNPLEIKLQ